MSSFYAAGSTALLFVDFRTNAKRRSDV